MPRPADTCAWLSGWRAHDKQHVGAMQPASHVPGQWAALHPQPVRNRLVWQPTNTEACLLRHEIYVGRRGRCWCFLPGCLCDTGRLPADMLLQVGPHTPMSAVPWPHRPAQTAPEAGLAEPACRACCQAAKWTHPA